MPGYVLVAALYLLPGPEVHAASFTVDSGGDDVDPSPGDGICSTAGGGCTLRAAIQESNALPGRDLVTLGVPKVTLSLAGSAEDAAAAGDLDVTDDLDIDGDQDPEPLIKALATIDGGGLDRVFHILGADVTMSTLLVTGGVASSGEDGGGILNAGTLSAEHVAIENCRSVSGDGGGLYNAGTVVFTNGHMQSNTAPLGRGGAIANGGAAAVKSGWMTFNTATAGGAVHNEGTFGAVETALGWNTGTAGAGALLNEASGNVGLSNLSVASVTSASGFAAGENHGAAVLRYVTVAGNDGPGWENDDPGGATTTSEGSILADSCVGTIASNGFNVSTSCALSPVRASDQTGVDPGLGDVDCDFFDDFLRGHCPNFLLDADSPAIGAGNPAGCFDHDGNELFRDQRSVLRPRSRPCDAGAIARIEPCESGRPMSGAKLVLTGLGRGPERQSMRFSSDLLVLAPLDPRPNLKGAQVLVEELGVGALVDRSHASRRPLWRQNSCQSFVRHGDTYLYKERGTCPPFPDGRLKVFKARDKLDTSSVVRSKFKLKGGTFDAPTGPVAVSVTFGRSAQHSQFGDCARHVFDPGDCRGTGNKMVCDQP